MNLTSADITIVIAALKLYRDEMLKIQRNPNETRDNYIDACIRMGRCSDISVKIRQPLREPPITFNSQNSVEPGDYVLDRLDPERGYQEVITRDGNRIQLADAGIMPITDIADIKLESEITG